MTENRLPACFKDIPRGEIIELKLGTLIGVLEYVNDALVESLGKDDRSPEDTLLSFIEVIKPVKDDQLSERYGFDETDTKAFYGALEFLAKQCEPLCGCKSVSSCACEKSAEE